MANQVEITITADSKSAEAGFKKVKSGFQSVKDSIIKNRKAIGLGLVAMGAGIEGLAKSQQGLTESTRKLSNATGMSEKEIRDMATSLSNATFPLDSALQLMTLGAQQGLESADALSQYAAFWDTVGDATGLSAEALAKAGAALGAVGVEIGNESDLLGAFGLITRTGTQSVQDFLDGIGKLAPEMAAMGISVDEAAVIMTAMEQELSLTARTARTEFKEALEQSETGLAGVMEQLGLSENQLEKYRAKLEESTGFIQADADAHASTKTVMDKLKASMQDLMFANGALIEKASLLAPIFMAAGPIVAGFSGIVGLLTPALSAARLAFIGLNLSMGPIALIVLGIAAAVTAGILIWKNWDKIVQFFKKHWDKMVFALPLILGPIGLIILAIVQLAKHWRAVFNGMRKVFDLVLAAIKATWDMTWAGIKTTFDMVSGALIRTFQTVKSTILGIWDDLVSGIKGAVNAIINGINTVIRGINKFKITVPGVSVLGKTIIPGFSVGLPQIPEIPTMAKGGIVNRPTLAMLGESGPEAVVPLGRGAGAGMTVNLVINGDINGMDDFEQKVTAVIRDAVLGGGFSGVLARA